MISDLFMGLLLLSLILLNPSISVINEFDVAVVATLCASVLAGFILLVGLKLIGIYTHFRVVTILTGISLVLLLASALFGGHGNEIHDGSLPWVAAYVGLLVAFCNASQVRRDAYMVVFGVVLFCLTLLFVSIIKRPPETVEAITAMLCLLVAFFLIPIHSTILTRIQAGVHGTILREMHGDIKQSTSSNHLNNEETFASTGLADIDAFHAWVNELENQYLEEHSQLLHIQLPEIPTLRSHLGEDSYARFLDDVISLVSRDFPWLEQLATVQPGHLLLVTRGHLPDNLAEEKERLKRLIKQVLLHKGSMDHAGIEFISLDIGNPEAIQSTLIQRIAGAEGQ